MEAPKVLVYDIETTPVLAWIWRCGKQVVRSAQIHEEHSVTKIICITYMWEHEKKPHALVFDMDTLDDTKVIEEFDKLIAQADVVIGKNNVKFDDKHVNFRRFMNGLPPMPDWTRTSDDLERQMRKHFNMQSYGLDYFTKLLDGSGKIRMDFQDWIDIIYHKKQKALDKMVKYGKKDVHDTVKLIKKLRPYVSFKYNYAAHYGELRCASCGSKNIYKNGTRMVGSVRKQRWSCRDCGGHAGYTTIGKDKITK